MTDIIIIECRNCKQMIECEYDNGYPGSFYEPPQPGFWFSRKDTLYVDDQGNEQYCDHEASYNMQDATWFQDNLSTIAIESEFQLPDVYIDYGDEDYI